MELAGRRAQQRIREGKGWILQGVGGRIHLVKAWSQASPSQTQSVTGKSGKTLLCKSRAGQDGVELKPQKIQGRNDRELLSC